MYEIEKKYILSFNFHEKQILDFLNNYEIEMINQSYCDGFRLRSLVNLKDKTTEYWFNKKIKSKIISGADIEIEQLLTKDIYEDLILNRNSGLSKYRIKFEDKDLGINYDIDQFYYVDLLGNELFYFKTLEVELPNENTDVVIPDFLKKYIIKEFKLSNNSLAKIKESERLEYIQNNLMEGIIYGL